MAYDVLPNIIFLVSALGAVSMVLRRLPEAQAESQIGAAVAPPGPGLLRTWLQAAAAWLSRGAGTAWRFALEAKDLAPTSLVGYRARKIATATAPDQQRRSVPRRPSVDVTEQGEHELLERIRREPKNVEAYEDLALFYLNHQQFQDAYEAYSFVSSRQRERAEVHGRLGFCAYKLRKFGEAAAHYERALSLDSSDPKRYYNLAMARQALGQLQDAVVALEHAVAADPSQSRFALGLADALAKAGSGERAKQVLRQAAERFPDEPEVRAKLSALG